MNCLVCEKTMDVTTKCENCKLYSSVPSYHYFWFGDTLQVVLEKQNIEKPPMKIIFGEIVDKWRKLYLQSLPSYHVVICGNNGELKLNINKETYNYLRTHLLNYTLSTPLAPNEIHLVLGATDPDSVQAKRDYVMGVYRCIKLGIQL